MPGYILIVYLLLSFSDAIFSKVAAFSSGVTAWLRYLNVEGLCLSRFRLMPQIIFTGRKMPAPSPRSIWFIYLYSAITTQFLECRLPCCKIHFDEIFDSLLYMLLFHIFICYMIVKTDYIRRRFHFDRVIITIHTLTYFASQWLPIYFAFKTRWYLRRFLQRV